MVRIVAGGDLSPGDHYFNLGHGVREQIERRGLGVLLEELSPLFRSADIAFCNLEGPTSDEGLVGCDYRSVAFRGSPEVPAALRSAGITMVSVANNHILQHGLGAFHDTVERLIAATIDPVGLRGNEGWTCRPVIKKIGSTTVGVLGYSLVPEQFYLSGTPPYAAAMPEEVLWDVRRLRTITDIVVVSCHYGEEGTAEPGKAEHSFSLDLVDSGATVVLGHHPHVFQPVEACESFVLASSLGHLLFDLFWDVRSCASSLLDIQVDRAGIHAVGLHPFMIESGCKVRLSRKEGVHAAVSSSMTIRQPLARESQGSGYPPASCKGNQAQLRKMMYFLSNIWRGNRKAKLSFLADKLGGRLWR